MKTYGKVALQFQAFLTSALNEVSGQLHAPPALPRYVTGGWVSHTVIPGTSKERGVFCPCRKSKHDSSLIQFSHLQYYFFLQY
jgi:hypothetical protein